MKRIRNRTVNVGRDQLMIEGIRKDLPGFTELHLAGETFTPATLEARFHEARTHEQRPPSPPLQPEERNPPP